MLLLMVPMMKFTVWCFVMCMKLTLLCAKASWTVFVFLFKATTLGVIALVGIVGTAVAQRKEQRTLTEQVAIDTEAVHVRH